MGVMMGVHIAAGVAALFAGAAAAGARKGGMAHARAGTVFAAVMLVLGVTAAWLDTQKDPPASPVSGVFVCYFVATAWAAARRRDAAAGWIERVACAAALGAGALMLWGAFAGTAAPTPVGMGPVFGLGGLCLLAGLADLRVVLGRALTPKQRTARHLWRMCFAFFIATGSFFLGQQDVLPKAVQGSPVLFGLAFAPFGLMVYGLARTYGGKLHGRPPGIPAAGA